MVLRTALVTLAVCGAAAHRQREQDFAAAAGLTAGPDKYANGNTLKPFDTSTPGAFFSGGFTNHTVLQREPGRAAVYGYAVQCSRVHLIVDDLRRPGRYNLSAVVWQDPGRNYSYWKVLLDPAPAGGQFAITVAGSVGASQTIWDVTFGDVWFCSGQSNMWLVMHFDTSRNATYDQIIAGKYANIRMWTMPMNNQPDGGYKGYDLHVAPPPPPRQIYGGYPGGGWLLPDVGAYANKTCREGRGDQGDCPTCCTAYPQPDDTWNYNTVDQFSAACWHFGQRLTDMAEANGEPVVPLGLVTSNWGGTMVEFWQPNATLNAGACRNSSGGAYAPWQNKRWDIDSGALWNGMIAPVLNTTIKGALWYQGENNVFQCHDANSRSWSQHGPRGGGPLACGSVSTRTGYACLMQNLIRTWRAAWSAVPGTTPANFPFGLVTLAGGTSEGNGENMGSFRYAQSLNTGFLNATDNTFVAQAYDAGDPCSGGNQCCTNHAAGQGWACMAGLAPYTGQFMGGIHPRVKQIVGHRLAAAARAIAYGDKSIVYTGPVLRACQATGGSFRLSFDAELLRDDTIMVLQRSDSAISMVDSGGQGISWTPELLSLAQQLGPESPMEVQLNGDVHNASSGVWIPVTLGPKCPPRDNDHVNPGAGVCGINATTGAKLDGWNEVQFQVPADLVPNVTAIRYAWGEYPCCPSANKMIVPCPPMSCPIQSFNSSLPAVPFWASVTNGKCDWISTQGPPH